MPDERLTKYDLTELRAKYHEIERQTTAGVLNRYFLPSIDNWLQMLLDCHAFSIDRRARDEHSSLMEAYASVSSVAYSNAESGRVALLRGFYGNVFSLIRPLAMANDLVIDLTNTAQSPENWKPCVSSNPRRVATTPRDSEPSSKMAPCASA
jgi:hypothetical protein